MKIKIERIQKGKDVKKKKSGQFQWASIEKWCLPFGFTVM